MRQRQLETLTGQPWRRKYYIATVTASDSASAETSLQDPATQLLPMLRPAYPPQPTQSCGSGPLGARGEAVTCREPQLAVSPYNV